MSERCLSGWVLLLGSVCVFWGVCLFSVHVHVCMLDLCAFQ